MLLVVTGRIFQSSQSKRPSWLDCPLFQHLVLEEPLLQTELSILPLHCKMRSLVTEMFCIILSLRMFTTRMDEHLE